MNKIQIKHLREDREYELKKISDIKRELIKREQQILGYYKAKNETKI